MSTCIENWKIEYYTHIVVIYFKTNSFQLDSFLFLYKDIYKPLNSFLCLSYYKNKIYLEKKT
jgi:hypothetical protein